MTTQHRHDAIQDRDMRRAVQHGDAGVAEHVGEEHGFREAFDDPHSICCGR